MAVKKHELVPDNRNQLDLNALAQYIQLMNDQPSYLPPPNELVKNCQDIVKCLARTSGTPEELWEILQSVEEFLHRVVNSVHSSLRHEVVTAVIDKFHSFISDPQSDACPAASVVLVVLDVTDNEAILSAARWLVQQRENGPAGEGLRASLSCLYRWMYEWHGTPGLGNWIMAYIKALEENEKFDILIEVSIDNIGRLFKAIEDPVLPRQAVADVIFHVLASLSESVEAFDRISPFVDIVLMNLAADSGRWSRQLLQNVVDILTAISENLLDNLKTQEAQDMFKDKYASFFFCLGQHMASRGYRGQKVAAWRPKSTAKKPPPITGDKSKTLLRRAGLLNLGNTCYMNSVMQALLVTRRFSNHVVQRMNSAPYWSRLSVLFAKMMFSITNKLNPNEFFTVVRSPLFIGDNQHDSSEFLGYLFELLQSYEHESDRNFDYSRTAQPCRRSQRMIALANTSPAHTSDNETDSNGNRRSMSPRPGTSARTSAAAGSSSGSQRRPHEQDQRSVPPKKRMRLGEPTTCLRRNSFIDSLFGGALLTRIECLECHTSSLSRDVFWDLQLAFPDKPEGWQHSVQNLLEYFCSSERLCGNNQYDCNDCGALRDAERSVVIETTPKYLILVLKNFKFEPKLQVQTKLMHSMYYNDTITLPTVRPQADHAAYILYAAIIHEGTTLDSGHYYTIAKEPDSWTVYNDDVVTSSTRSELNVSNRACTPYILFYRRTDIEEMPEPTLRELPPSLQASILAHNKYYVEDVHNRRIARP